ncbi:MAG: hypothetical protein CM15mP98_10220 [Paracoccaceae bacterium]|nr:MAG: hypothetical protein CM15mP98_10220 [Paracoccaceae bacterium]
MDDPFETYRSIKKKKDKKIPKFGLKELPTRHNPYNSSESKSMIYPEQLNEIALCSCPGQGE